MRYQFLLHMSKVILNACHAELLSCQSAAFQLISMYLQAEWKTV